MAVPGSRAAGVLHGHLGSAVARATRVVERFDGQRTREMGVRGLLLRRGVPEQFEILPNGSDSQYMPHLVKDQLLHVADSFLPFEVGRIEAHTTVDGQLTRMTHPARAGLRKRATRTIDLLDDRHDHHVVDCRVPLESRVAPALQLWAYRSGSSVAARTVIQRSAAPRNAVELRR